MPLFYTGLHVQCTLHVQAALARLRPVSGFVDPLAEAQDLTLLKPSTAAEQRLLNQLSSGRSNDHRSADSSASELHIASKQSRCRYTSIPPAATSARAADLTAANLDKSTLLEEIFLSKPEGDELLLSELQFSFATFLVGKSLESARLLHNTCSCLATALWRAEQLYDVAAHTNI